ncbi:uncharacterized protein AKAW2_51127A [Aspergillus luchuensis]|uniref:Uncharacterized protein n=1 Tax=Aspergillus kawachii TaxID=1069201 RepID=A0A7R7WDB9_ASPKA|nr:uncharacterized protein AKAW2_51127A [Aspergillus luchuensis]BCS00786.1 hypothetical protein AKAW2_51127A [Aspergillus luchuensis]BCS12548.1 hypothetical protein ALUC_50594A [Aspergillus luchuensis]
MAGLLLHRHFPNFSLFFFFLPDSFVSSYHFFVVFSWIEVICFRPFPVTLPISVSPSATPPTLQIRFFGSRIFPCGCYLIGQPSIAVSLWTCITRYGERVVSVAIA